MEGDEIMSEKLKPCPFCGSEDLEFRFQRFHGDTHEEAICSIICHGCAVHAGYLFYSDEDAMIKKQRLKHGTHAPLNLNQATGHFTKMKLQTRGNAQFAMK